MAIANEDSETRAAVEHELLLLEPQTRRSPERVAELLHPDFTEFGASGRAWDRAAMLAAIASPDLTPDEPPTVRGIRATSIRDGAVLVTYTSQGPAGAARRSSLWLRGDDGCWRLYFHQGTPSTPDQPR